MSADTSGPNGKPDREQELLAEAIDLLDNMPEPDRKKSAPDWGSVDPLLDEEWSERFHAVTNELIELDSDIGLLLADHLNSAWDTAYSAEDARRSAQVQGFFKALSDRTLVWRSGTSNAPTKLTTGETIYMADMARAELLRRNTQALHNHAESMKESSDASYWLAFAVLFVALVQVALIAWQLTGT